MIILIDNYDSFTYNLYQSIACHALDVLVIRNNKITSNQVLEKNPQGIILSPGPGKPENAGICIELIKTLINNPHKKIPLLGVCLGHQAIVSALGGNIIKCHEISHGKKDFIFHNRKGLYKGLPLPLEVGRYHSLIADPLSLPSDLIIEAENPMGIIMSVRHKTLPIYGVQYHPESILTEKGNILLENFASLCKATEAV